MKETALIIGRSVSQTRRIYHSALDNLRKSVKISKIWSLIYGENMRKKNEEEEKIKKMLESVKPPELSNEEIETNKNELQQIISDRFYEITVEREKKRIVRRRIYYSLTAVSLAIILFTIGLFVIKPFMNREAVVRIIRNNLSIEVNRDDVLLKNGEGIVINNDREIVVNISNGVCKTHYPVPYEPSQEEKGHTDCEKQ